MKKLFSIKYIYTAVVFFLLMLAYQVPADAQTEYDEDDYDDYYESAYSSGNPYEKYQPYKEEERYKKSAREEDLYNGHYRNFDNNNAGYPGLGMTGLGKRKSNSGSAYDGASAPRSRNKGAEGPDRGLDQNPSNDRPVDANGSYDPNDGKISGGEDSDQFGPPPPPDEPDVPVDTAIPFLIVAGIGLAGFKFYIRKKASVA